MRYEFATAGRIIVGPGSSTDLPALALEFGGRALLVHRRNEPVGSPVDLLARRLLDEGPAAASYAVSGEPEIAVVEEGARLAHEHGCDLAIGIGGGSVLDAAKAIGALAANDGSALDYMEVVGAGRALPRPALPVVAVPTTAGTGSEVTRNAVVTAGGQRVKASIRHASMLPRLALVDSLLTHDLPPQVTASCGMDALTQLLEPYVSRRATPLTDGLCLEGLALVGWALRRAFHTPGDASAREAMSLASLLSGMALANAGLGGVHGIAAPLGGMYHAPHGAVCAALLPPVTAVNLAALRRRMPDHPAIPRYARVAEALLGRPGATPDDLVGALRDLVAEFDIPPLRSYGLAPDGIPDLAVQSLRASSMRANPLDLEPHEIEEAISAAW